MTFISDLIQGICWIPTVCQRTWSAEAAAYIRSRAWNVHSKWREEAHMKQDPGDKPNKGEKET